MRGRDGIRRDVPFPPLLTGRHDFTSMDTPLVTKKSPSSKIIANPSPPATAHTHTHTHIHAHTPTNLSAAIQVTTDINNQRLKYINDTVKMRTALVFVAILATAYAACDAPNGD